MIEVIIRVKLNFCKIHKSDTLCQNYHTEYVSSKNYDVHLLLMLLNLTPSLCIPAEHHNFNIIIIV